MSNDVLLILAFMGLTAIMVFIATIMSIASLGLGVVAFIVLVLQGKNKDLKGER